MNDTAFLKFIAIALILNSHCDPFYPIKAFATGGTIGLSLFFGLSSFGLLLSERKKPRGFHEWYGRRIKRIYPSVWVLLIIVYLPIKVLTGGLRGADTFSVFGMFFYPPFWFLQSLMIFYFLGFFIIKNYHRKKLHYFTFASMALYLIGYLYYLNLSEYSIESLPFRAIFYFLIFLFGIFLGTKSNKIIFSGPSDFLALVFFISLTYVHKYLMTKNSFMSLQIIQHLLMFPSLYYFLKLARSDFVNNRIMQLPPISNIITYISSLTLELFMVNVTISPVICTLNLPFPMNVIIFMVLTFVMAALLHYVSACLSESIVKFS
ncbi:MAG: acyltransferase family protein [bacterium]